jgi:hypothetical protein
LIAASTDTSQSYVLRGDVGLTTVDVINPAKDDVASRYLPLQWAIDSVSAGDAAASDAHSLTYQHFINMSTGILPPSPMVWSYTNESDSELNNVNRLSESFHLIFWPSSLADYLAGIRGLIVLAHFVVFLGIIYQLPGSMASERAAHLTNHLEAMGCRRSARLM